MIRIAGHALPTTLDYLQLDGAELQERIQRRKRELNAVILGHNYQRVEIQEVSDYLGDSLGLSQEAAQTDADVIVFCGVHFMAETAKVLSPGKTVLMPDLRAGCPMADFVTGEALRRLMEEHPSAAVVTYVNSTAEVKALSDICCTSSNAIQVVESIPRDQPIIFVPDKNLANYVQERTGRDNIIAWEGYCYVHDDMVMDELERARKAHPGAKVVVHPEARSELLAEADFVTSTSGMVALAEEHDELIIGTERGLVDRLVQQFPEKTLVPLSGAAICGNMKLNTLAKLAWCLDHEQYEVTLPEDVRAGAEKALRRMLELSGGWRPATEEEAELGSPGFAPAGVAARERRDVKVLTFTGGAFAENGYVAICEATREAVVVDPGASADGMVAALRQEGVHLAAILLTHAHLDHVEGVPEVRSYSDAPIYLHRADVPLYERVREQAIAFGVPVPDLPNPTWDLNHDEVFTFGEVNLDVRHTPGHSPGHVILVAENKGVVFVGDVVFSGSIGRTDLPGGDYRTLLRSIRDEVLTLADDVRLLPGHGPPTTVGQEREDNPFLVPEEGGGLG